MRTLSMTALALVSAMLFTPAHAGEAKVNFEKVDDYTDFEPANGLEERYQKRLMEELTGYFNELSADLPDGQTLAVTVTDIDLTGRLEPTFGESTSNFIRVVRSIDFPTMDFNYSLTDSNGSVIKQEDVELKDMSFDFDTMAAKRSRSDDLYYEKKMLKDWFRKTFSEHVASSQPAESA